MSDDDFMRWAGSGQDAAGRPGTQGTSGLADFRHLLALLNYDEMSVIRLASKSEGGIFRPYKVTGIRAAAELAESLLNDDLYFGVNQVKSSVLEGRGTSQDVERVAALYADLDFKPSGLGSEQIARLVIAELSGVLGIPPAATVHTGNGLQPYWLLDDLPNDDATRRIFARFRALVDRTAARHGGRVDPVFDLARMLRVPGTKNYKDRVRPIPVSVEFVAEGATR